MFRSSVKKVHYCDNNNKCESETEFNDQREDFYIDMVSRSSQTDRAFIELNVDSFQTPISFKIDTGRSANILPVKYFHKLKVQSPLEPSEHKLSAYTGNMLPVTGKVTLPCK